MATHGLVVVAVSALCAFAAGCGKATTVNGQPVYRPGPYEFEIARSPIKPTEAFELARQHAEKNGRPVWHYSPPTIIGREYYFWSGTSKLEGPGYYVDRFTGEVTWRSSANDLVRSK